MTRKQKIKIIYQNKPALVNDDVGLVMFILNKYLAKHNEPSLTKGQELAFREMGNPEHITRDCRKLRESDIDIIRLLSPVAQKARYEQQEAKRIEYSQTKIIEEASHAVSWMED